jgi:hypothetical protein
MLLDKKYFPLDFWVSIIHIDLEYENPSRRSEDFPVIAT